MAKNARSNSGQLQGTPISRDEIAKRAHAIFERNGCQHGCDVENWLAAEAELKAEQKQEPARRPRATA